MVTFWFDMDGTLADLYGEDEWLAHLCAENTQPYRSARPLVDTKRLAQAMLYLMAEGYRFGVISWTSKNGSPEYNKRVRSAKVRWLERYFPGLFDEVHIVKYGTPKSKFARQGDWLFDDEERNRKEWREKIGQVKTEREIFSSLEW